MKVSVNFERHAQTTDANDAGGKVLISIDMGGLFSGRVRRPPPSHEATGGRGGETACRQYESGHYRRIIACWSQMAGVSIVTEMQ